MEVEYEWGKIGVFAAVFAVLGAAILLAGRLDSVVLQLSLGTVAVLAYGAAVWKGVR